MKNELIFNVISQMSDILNSEQLARLKTVLHMCLKNYTVVKDNLSLSTCNDDNFRYLRQFLLSKGASGLSQKTLDNYSLTIRMFLSTVNKPIGKYHDDDFICYLEMYRRVRKVSFSRIKNMQSALNSFWSWLFKKQIVNSNPVAALDSIKLPKKIKQPLSDEDREILKLHCNRLRDLALMEFLYSTGVRVSELTSLNISDISFSSKDCIVYGKGGKDREVYINAPTCIYLKQYLDSRTDDNPALFVSSRSPHSRLSKNAIEAILRSLGNRCGISNVHPHRFRRTMATNALNRGMPIEQVSRLLGHSKLDTTQIYCTVSQENVRLSHKKYLSA